MIWNYNQRPHQALFILVVFAVLIIILLFVAQKSYPEELEVTAELTVGYSTIFERPYVDQQMTASLHGFTVYGGARTDIQASEHATLSFGPLRSVYSIGAKFSYKWLEIGWYHQCTHRGDYATYDQWCQMWKPNEDDYYVKFSFTR